jgi:hypothetical protein
MGSYCPECGAELDDTESKEQDNAAEVDNEQVETEEDSIEEDFTEEDSIEEESGIDIKHLGKALIIALIPAFGLYVMTSIALFDPIPAVFFVGIAAFGYLLYKRPTTKRMAGGASFWLAIESFLTPLALLIYTFSFASQETQTGAGEAGAAIGGFILVIIAFVICVPLGIVFYLISGKLDPDESN